MELTGRIKKIMEVQNVSDKFKKREFVVIIDENTQYPQQVLFQTTQEKCSLLDNLKPNDEVKVHFNIRGREWTANDGQVKYFVTLEAWRIEKFVPVGGEQTVVTSSKPSQTSNASYAPNTTPSNNTPSSPTDVGTDISSEDGQDLPF